jgi:hypothetical protein
MHYICNANLIKDGRCRRRFSTQKRDTRCRHCLSHTTANISHFDQWLTKFTAPHKPLIAPITFISLRLRNFTRYPFCHLEAFLLTSSSLVSHIRLLLSDLTQLHFPDELINLHRGQGLEILWRDSLQCPTEEEYIGMVNNSMLFQETKHESLANSNTETGGLFRIAVKLMMSQSQSTASVHFVLHTHRLN